MPQVDFVVHKRDFDVELRMTKGAAAEAIVESVREWNPVKEFQRTLPQAASDFFETSTIERAGLPVSVDVLMAMRLTFAAYTLKNLVEIDRHKIGGVPVLAGTRFTIAQILAELGDGNSISKLAKGFGLDKQKLSELLHTMAIYFDRPFTP